MSTAFWILAVLSMGGACLCAAQSSCYREQGDERSRDVAATAVGLFIGAVLCGLNAWRLQ